MSQSNIDIVPVTTDAQVKAFLGLPYDLYRGMPNWRAPLRMERSDQYSPKNPGRKDFQVQSFLAYKDGACVGRISAFINPAHQALYKDGAGHFGYFDCTSDTAVAATLLRAAEDWHREAGSKKIIGPAQWSVNEECGLLIDGFDTPPFILMPFGREDYQAYVKDAGYKKAMDLWAYEADLTSTEPRPRAVQRLRQIAGQDATISFRAVDMGNYKRDVEIAMNIFNDAWSENWGFVPFTPDQVDHMAKEMRPILSKDLFWFGLIDGEEVAFGLMIPDVNEAAIGLDGRLMPFGWAKLLYRLKLKGLTRSRIPLLGLRKEWHNTRRGLAVIAEICERNFAYAQKAGYQTCELSWILETNKSMQAICDQVKARHYKTYRMYEKTLS